MTRKLLTHFDLKTPYTSYHEYTGTAKIRQLVERIAAGETMALVSDAGTPGISDPGAAFVAALVREAGSQVKIIPVPGPSAAIALLSASGLYADRFVFHGFPPHKKGRTAFWKTVAEEERTSVFYESPHRVEKAMEELAPLCKSDRKIVIGRELTKIYESVRYGTMGDAIGLLASEPIKGEYVIAVEGK
jgi:16S rRNA (cytidine1402-2'-O)-methyltransferase